MEETKNNVDFKMSECIEEDFDFCYELFKENMKEIIDKHWGWKEDIFKHNFRVNEIRIIKHDQVKIGYFQIQYKKELTFIKEMQITKEFQNKGIGTEILNIIKKEAQKENLSTLELRVFKDSPAKKLFEKFGFEQTKDLDTTIIMEY